MEFLLLLCLSLVAKKDSVWWTEDPRYCREKLLVSTSARLGAGESSVNLLIANLSFPEAKGGREGSQ
jgi:hypothetical protein